MEINDSPISDPLLQAHDESTSIAANSYESNSNLGTPPRLITVESTHQELPPRPITLKGEQVMPLSEIVNCLRYGYYVGL